MQLSIFDAADPIELSIYDLLIANQLDYQVERYKQYREHEEYLKYYYVKTTCGRLLDVGISDLYESSIFQVYDRLNPKLIDKRVAR